MKALAYPLTIGPTHPTFKEPMRVRCQIEGERIVDFQIDMGFTHRGIELAATRRNFVQVIYLVERICGICSVSHPMAFCQAVEEAAGIVVPPRAQYIRTIVAELERLHSHNLWCGVMSHQMGFDTLFYYTWTIRESVMDGLERLTGNRVNYAMIAVGGVRRDIEAEGIDTVRAIIEDYDALYESAKDLFLFDASVRARCSGVGVLTRSEAERLGAVGPTARASAVPRDVRVDAPYMAYADMDWLVPVLPQSPGGDVMARIEARLLEIRQSLEILEFCIDHLPEGEISWEPNNVKLLRHLKKVHGHGIGRCEAPRGEVCHYVVLDGRDGPVQLKAKAPTYSNLLTWHPMLAGAEIADIPIIIGSIDPCVACADRMSFVAGDGRSFALSAEDLRRRSLARMESLRRRS